MKYSDFTLGEIEALINILGEDKVRALLRGELTVEFKNAIRALIDQHGRCIPPKGMGGVVDANRVFKVELPGAQLSVIHQRLADYFPTYAKFVPVNVFGAQAAALFAEVNGSGSVANLLKGPYLPICLPQIPEGGYGTVLEKFFLPVLERAYQEAFPDRTFQNRRKGYLANKVTVVDERHAKLVERMKQEPLVGLYFPVALQGFGIEAARQMVKHLPEGFYLTGPFETATAIVADTQTLCRGVQTTGYDCAAVSWESAKYSLNFGTNVGLLVFGRRDLVALGGCSSGLLFIR